MRIVDLNENTKKDLLGELLKRNPGQYKEYEDSVAKIIADVRDNGDKALFGYTLKSVSYTHLTLPTTTDV